MADRIFSISPYAEIMMDFVNFTQFGNKCKTIHAGHINIGKCFSFGGWIANMMAVNLPDLSAAVPFYVSHAPLKEVAKIQAPFLLQYAELDKRITDGWPEYEKALKINNKKFTGYVYPAVNHGFHNNTTPRYDKEAAELAWKLTINFFTMHL